MIDRFESGAPNYSLPKSDQSPIYSDQLPCEDISDPSITATDNTEQQDEDTPSNLTVPTDQSPENILEVTTPTRLVHLKDKTIGYQLPFRQNRGKPQNRYSPDIDKTSKYPIANHVSTEKLSEPLKAFVHQLSAIHIPTKVSEALKDPKWVQAIKEEMKALEKNQMAEWEEWVPSASGGEYGPDFPRLQELILTNCPKLSKSLPCHLPCLKKLTVSGCEVLHDEGTNTTTTRSLNYRSLEELEIEGGCQKGLLSLLVDIGNFVDIQCLPNRNCLQRLILRNCPMLSSFPKDGLPTTLTTLYIQNCKRLEFLPDEMLAKLTSLESLWIENSCDSLRNFSLSIFPKLEKLDIGGSENLESLSFIEEGINENLSHLRELFIYDCPNLMCFQCQGGWPTPNLNDFSVGECKNLKSLPEGIHTLTTLRGLHVDDLPNLESFAEGGLPPNIRHLCTRSCERLRAPVVKYWGLEGLVSLEYFIIGGSILETLLKEHLLPTTLRTLVISGCDSILVLPGEGEGLQHLTSLQALQIDACDNLQFLPGKGLQHLTSLRTLSITSCHSIQFLPEKGLPPSLSLLSIRNCSALEKRYQNKKGKKWAKISHIPCIKINDQVIII